MFLAAAGPARGPSRTDKLLAVVPAQGETLRVIATLLHGPSLDGSPDSTVEVIRFVDRRGATVYSDSLLPWVTPEGVLQEEVSVAAGLIPFEGGTGLVLDRCGLPAIEGTCGTCRWFVPRGRRLVPVTPWCNVCGELEPGKRATAQVWTTHFTVFVPVRIRFERREGGIDIVPLRDPASGLAILKTDGMGIAYRSYGADTTFRVKLYRGPRGNAGDSMTVTPTFQVELGHVYGEVGWWDAALPGGGGAVTVEIVRLEVVVNGRRGFVDEDDFEGLGLFTRS